jgi:tripartite ATP-independent transporter DctP family solute receptor
LKRTLIFALTLALVLSFVTGCGNSSSSAAPAAPATSAPAETQAADSYKWIVAVNTSEGDILYETVDKFCDLVEEYSEGKITTELYGGTQLGSGQELLEGMSYGVANVYAESIGTLAPFTKYANIDAVPYLYSGYDHFIKTWQSDLGEEMRNKIGEEAGFKIMGGMYRGARITTAKKEMDTIAEFKGFKLRAPNIPVYIKTWEWLGASPTPLAITETYTAIQQGTVDGQENPISECWNYGFAEVCPYWIKTNHVYSQDCFFMNLDYFNSLSPEAQEIAVKAAAEASAWRNQQMITREADVEKKAIDAGVKIVNVDNKEFMAKFDGFVETVFPDLTDWAKRIRELA